MRAGVEKIDEGERTITTPYDPSKTNIVSKTQSVDSWAKRIAHGEIDMAPEFQRHADFWSAEKMSRLIESLLIRIPLPRFCFDGSDDNQWLIVDGLQRLSTLKRFLVEKELALTGLEYLKDYDQFRFEELPRDLQRRIEKTQVTLHIIQAGTPREVKFNIFKRINTGRLSLTPQEIRHALYPGPAAGLLAHLAKSEEFQAATAGNVSPRRMTDQEMVLRFLAFRITGYQRYNSPDDSSIGTWSDSTSYRRTSVLTWPSNSKLPCAWLIRSLINKHSASLVATVNVDFQLASPCSRFGQWCSEADCSFTQPRRACR